MASLAAVPGSAAPVSFQRRRGPGGSAPRIVSVAAGSPAERCGLVPGDEIVSIDGVVPRDVIEYRLAVDEADPKLVIRRGHGEIDLVVIKDAGEPLGAEVSSALFDRVRTCDNHCEFCFIHQLPKGMRRSLYLQDDDYRLSFLYGNFTTLTRFTELDFERVVEERLSPLFVSIHATDPEVRAKMLRNRRGATSLRWLGALLDAGIEVHGQIVVCPGVNDGVVLEQTLADIADRFSQLATLGVVPLGVSRYSSEPAMRPHFPAEAEAVLSTVEQWQELYRFGIGRRLVYAADEYYLLARRPFPAAEAYDGFPQHENGIGMAAAFKAAFSGDVSRAMGVQSGFFAWVDGAPAAGYRAPRTMANQVAPCSVRPGPVASGAVGKEEGYNRKVTVLSGEYGARVLQPILHPWAEQVEVVAVPNRFFGGNIAVTGLLTGADIADVLSSIEPGRRVLLPDVCLSEGRFLDGSTLGDLPSSLEVIPSDGWSLRQALVSSVSSLAAGAANL